MAPPKADAGPKFGNSVDSKKPNPDIQSYDEWKEKMPILRQGRAAQFFRKVIEYKNFLNDPRKKEEFFGEVFKCDQEKDLKGLRGEKADSHFDWAARLCALVAKKITFGPKGVSLDIDTSALANGGFIHAGHFLDEVFPAVNIDAAQSKRTLGQRGAEYQNQNGKIAQSGSNILIPYDDIRAESLYSFFPEDTEKAFLTKRRAVSGETRMETSELATFISSQNPDAPPPPRSLASRDVPENRGEKFQKIERFPGKRDVRFAVDVHQGTDPFLYFGSSSAIRLWAGRDVLSDAGFFGHHGKGPLLMLDFMKENWDQLGVRFREGATVSLVGMMNNVYKPDLKTSDEYGDYGFHAYEKMAEFLEGKAKDQGKNIRVVFWTTPPDSTRSARHIAGVNAFNEKVRLSKYYDPAADLAKEISPNGSMLSSMSADGKHVDKKALVGFAKRFQESVSGEQYARQEARQLRQKHQREQRESDTENSRERLSLVSLAETAFVGDSITVGMKSEIRDAKMVAQGSRQTGWMEQNVDKAFREGLDVKRVVVLGGINDVMSTIDSATGKHITLESVEDHLRNVYSSARKEGSSVIGCTLSWFDAQHWSDFYKKAWRKNWEELQKKDPEKNKNAWNGGVYPFSADDLYQRAQALNDWIKAQKGVLVDEVVDLWEVTQNHEIYSQVDGLHFDPKGRKALVQNILEHGRISV